MRDFFLLVCFLVWGSVSGQSTSDAAWTRVQDLHENIKALEAELAPLQEENKDRVLLMKMERNLEDKFNALADAMAAYRATTFVGLNELILERLARDDDGAREPINNNILGKTWPKDYTGYLVGKGYSVYLRPDPIRILLKLSPVNLLIGEVAFEATLVLEDEQLLYGGKIDLESGEAADRNDVKIVQARAKKRPLPPVNFRPTTRSSITPAIEAAKKQLDAAARQRILCRSGRRSGGCPDQETLDKNYDAAQEKLDLATRNPRLQAEVEAITYFQEQWKSYRARIDGHLLLKPWGDEYYLEFRNWALRNNPK